MNLLVSHLEIEWFPIFLCHFDRIKWSLYLLWFYWTRMDPVLYHQICHNRWMLCTAGIGSSNLLNPGCPPACTLRSLWWDHYSCGRPGFQAHLERPGQIHLGSMSLLWLNKSGRIKSEILEWVDFLPRKLSKYCILYKLILSKDGQTKGTADSTGWSSPKMGRQRVLQNLQLDRLKKPTHKKFELYLLVNPHSCTGVSNWAQSLLGPKNLDPGYTLARRNSCSLLHTAGNLRNSCTHCIYQCNSHKSPTCCRRTGCTNISDDIWRQPIRTQHCMNADRSQQPWGPCIWSRQDCMQDSFHCQDRSSVRMWSDTLMRFWEKFQELVFFQGDSKSWLNKNRPWWHANVSFHWHTQKRSCWHASVSFHWHTQKRPCWHANEFCHWCTQKSLQIEFRNAQKFPSHFLVDESPTFQLAWFHARLPTLRHCNGPNHDTGCTQCLIDPRTACMCGGTQCTGHTPRKSFCVSDKCKFCVAEQWCP